MAVTADDVKEVLVLLGAQQTEAVFGEWLRGIVESLEYGRCREAMEGLGIAVPVNPPFDKTYLIEEEE